LKTTYNITNIEEVDSPAVLVFPELISQNIVTAIAMAGDRSMLRPHVKTHKMAEVSRMLLKAGIQKFKCATIAEAEMLVIAGAKDILLAYQPTTVKAHRLAALAAANPDVIFGYLVDNRQSASALVGLLAGDNLRAWIDLNVGMNRTGISPGDAMDLYQFCRNTLHLQPVGLHAYDGHIHDTDVIARYQQAETILTNVMALKNKIADLFKSELVLVMGGTPCFPFYAGKPGVETSPGTFVFWDDSYTRMFPDMKFDIAAVVLTRIISVVDRETICLDLGHKSVASEGPLPRVFFPAHPHAKVVGHSEEHLVVNLPDTSGCHAGDSWFGIPTHICPTIALYESVQVVEDDRIIGTWRVIARDRSITY
jgi:D-serine deaminase-like pyridoxal phosphate-dependent protein